MSMFDDMSALIGTNSDKGAQKKAADKLAVKNVQASSSPWSDLFASTFGTATTVGATSPKSAGSYFVDELKKAGLKAGVKPVLSTLEKVKSVLAKIAAPDDACLILAWLGGAHDASDVAFASTSSGLSAQAACGQSLQGVDAAKKAAAAAGAAQGSIFGPTGALVGAAVGWFGTTVAGQKTYRSVGAALDSMAAVGPDLKKCSELIRSAGNAVAKESAKKQNKEANADALKLAKDALGAVTPQGLGPSLGVGLGVVAAVAVAVIVYRVLK